MERNARTKLVQAIIEFDKTVPVMEPAEEDVIQFLRFLGARGFEIVYHEPPPLEGVTY